MRRLLAALAAWTLLCAGAAAAPTSTDPARVPAGYYVLDKKHASLTLKILHLGFSRYTMRFNRLSGGFTYDPAAWQKTAATIEVEAASIDTGSEGFNKEIGGFFDAAKYPKITFVTRGFEAVEGSSAKLTGDLTFHGVTKPVTLDVVFNGVGPGVMGGGTRLGFSGLGRIKRSDFGVDNYSKMVGDDVDLMIEVEFYKK
jgi:polyisoprenoid-binding protein YceI